MNPNLIALVLCTASLTFAQNVSSSLKVTILDPSGASIPDAECSLVNQATGPAATVKSNGDGTCSFLGVLAGTYTLKVKANGFNQLETKDIEVTAGTTRTLGEVHINVGATSETVMVSGEVSQIQLATAEKSGLINQAQLQEVAVKGRDFFGLLTTVPGVVDNFGQARNMTTPDSLRSTFINGGRETQKNLTVDGITDMDTGSNLTVHFEPNMDSIAEVKIMTSNYQAEFGRNAAGVVTVITKGGGRSFHGTLYDSYRHEDLAANSFWNNRSGVPKAPYRFRQTGGTIGGPVFIPKKFNTSKDKLFFFWSEEFTGSLQMYGTKYVNMPTGLERNGDFSQSRASNGSLITITDPTTGSPFPGNVIPANRINTLGQSMLNFFPQPMTNWTPPAGYQYQENYYTQYSGSYPKREDMGRVDYNITPTLSVYWRFFQDKDEQTSPFGIWVDGGTNYNPSPVVFGQPGKGQSAHMAKTFSPTLVNEFTFGYSHNNLYFYPTNTSAVTRDKVGNPSKWFTTSGADVSYMKAPDYAPNITFGGQPSNVVNFSPSGSIPYENYNRWVFT